MKNYSNWSSAGKWLFGILTGGIGNILLKTTDNMINAANEMSKERRQTQKEFEETLTNSEEGDFSSDVVSDLGDIYNSTSENSYLSYRNNNSMPNFNSDVDNPWASWLNSKTGAGLTNNERIKMMYETWERQQAENFNHNEAVDARQYEMYMAQNKYQMETQSMAAAGVNPAMVYGGGSLVPTAATGTAGSVSPQSAPSAPTTGSLSGLIDVLSTIMRLPLEMKAINADIARTKKEGEAAIMNAESNKQNADSNARQAGAAEKRLSVEEERNRIEDKRVQIEDALAQSEIVLKDWEAKELSKKCLILEKQFSQMDEYLDIAKKDANSRERQSFAALQSSIASLKQADAAVQNAATADRMADYDSDLRMAQTFLTWAEGEGKDIVNKYLDDAEKARLENLKKQNLVLDEQGRLVHKEGNLATARAIREYINCATDIANSVSRFTGININTSTPGGTMPPLASGSYSVAGGYGTYYEP